MARTVRDSKLDSRTARLKLPAGLRHWRAITEKLALGYRRTAAGFGTWIARYFDEEKQTYVQTKLGTADDQADADGKEVLTFSQAQKLAQGDLRARSLARSGKGYTVQNAITDYLEWYESERKATGYKATKHTANYHILPKLGDELIATVKADKIRRWHRELAKTPARVRSSVRGKRQFREGEFDPRARKASANRVLTILKAALNHAFKHDMATDPNQWKAVEPFKNVDAPRVRFLSPDECRRLCNACKPDFRAIVQAALLTGGRYGELTHTDASDFMTHGGNGSILLRETKNRKPRYVPLTPEGAQLFEHLTAGKLAGTAIFTRNDGDRWGKSHQHRLMQDACAKAGIMPTISFHILRHTYAASLARNSVPLQVIAAALGHADTRVTERHYAHLSPSFVADTIRANLPELGIEIGNVRSIKSKQKITKLAPQASTRKKN